MTSRRDLVVVGAGPAGLTAARAARDDGLDVVLIDEQAEPGGQIWRAAARNAAAGDAPMRALGASYRAGAAVGADLCGLDLRFGAVVWHLQPDDAGWEVVCSRFGRAELLRCRRLLLASGAMERPVPLPGWTAPGVTTVGAVQLALKQSMAVPDGRLVLVGGGPLVLLLADQLAASGAPVSAMLDTAPPGGWARAARHLPGALAGAADTVVEGGRLLRQRARRGERVIDGVTPLVIETDAAGRARAIRYRDATGEHRLEADWIALHEGVVPNTQLTRLIGARHRWNPGHRCFEPVLGAYGKTSVEGVHVAGDGGGILGWRAARAAGALAAAEIALELGAMPEGAFELRAAALRGRLAAERRLRRFLDALYPPPTWLRSPADGTVLCRCEGVTAGQVRAVTALGCPGPNQLKAYLRAGMGPCQGRMCGLPVAEVLAAARDTDPAEIGLIRLRPPIKPVSLDELASLSDETAP